MAKVCVVTLFKHNYGAFLQAYASQRFLETLGFDAEVLDYDYYRDRTILGIYYGRIKKNPFAFIKNIAYKISRYNVSRQRDIILEKCANEKIKQTKYYKSYSALKENPPEADIYIVGSDQVWNPRLQEQGFLSRLLDFVTKPNAVLSSYAASVGIKQFTEGEKDLFREHLKKFDAISVREQASISLFEGLTDKKITVNKDPALLLKAEQWDLFKCDISTERPYIFVYLAQKSPDLIQYAQRIARENNWVIVDCKANINYEISGDIIGEKILSPMEFVGGIRNAAYVVTNSFHALVFCIHYSKRAYVQIPPNGASRLTELIDQMKLERLTDPTTIQEGTENDIYKHAESYLSDERERAKNYFMELNQIKASKGAQKV